jgi:conjugal transfer pilus assembly protein TraD
MLIRPYEMPWRPAYELWAGAAWVVGLCYFVVLGSKGLLTSTVALGLALFALLMAAHRLRQGLTVLTVRASLSGKAMQIITTRTHETLTRDPDQVFLGFGFEWLPVHSQRLYELAKIDYKDYAVSPAVLRLLGYAVNPQPDAEIGLPFIHGVEPREKALYRPLQNFEGGTLLVGTTQSGKGVALGSLLTQAIRRGDVVVSSTQKTAAGSSASCSARAATTATPTRSWSSTRRFRN